MRLPFEVVHKQHHIRAADGAPGAGDAQALYRFVAVAQTGGIDHMQWHALNLNGLPNRVPGGSSNRRDDGQLSACQGIEQRGFARIGLPGNHHLQAVAQQRALPRLALQQRNLHTQARKLPMGVGLSEEVQLFFRKIQGRLHQHAQVHQGIAQAVDLGGKRPAQAGCGAAGGRFGAGVDQVGNGLGLRQIHLAVQKCALAEFAGPRHAQAREDFALPTERDRDFQGSGQQTLQNHRPTVGLQLQHVFASKGMGRGEIERQAVVYGLAGCVRKRQIGRMAGLQRLPQPGLRHGAQMVATDPQYPHRPAPGGAGDSDDRVGVRGRHRFS